MSYDRYSAVPQASEDVTSSRDLNPSDIPHIPSHGSQENISISDSRSAASGTFFTSTRDTSGVVESTHPLSQLYHSSSQESLTMSRHNTPTNPEHYRRDSSDVTTSQARTSLDQRSSLYADRTAAVQGGSASLPHDDGMKKLRSQIHLIRDMALSSEEKAKRMHELMVADYEAFKLRSNTGSPASSIEAANRAIPDKQPSALEPTLPSQPSEDDDLAALLPADLKPTYHPDSNADNQAATTLDPSDLDEGEPVLGCPHYMRNVKIQCRDCKKWYTCRHCHNSSEDHLINRKSIKNMLCMLCWHPQRAGEYCQKCGELAAAYYCDICKLWENDTGKSIYHCEECGICRRGEGLGRDFVHCKKCNVCISIGWIDTHKCVERATECDCPICSLWLFTSSEAVVSMKCGHYIHRKCYDDYMKRSYKCPICNRSAVNMELQWRKLDQAILAQPMPAQFSETKALITCNDCGARTCTGYHWLGNKCTVCDSYNTNKISLINTPPDDDVEAVANSSEALTLREIGRSINEGEAPATLPLEPAEISEAAMNTATNLAIRETGQLSADEADTDARVNSIGLRIHNIAGRTGHHTQNRSIVTNDELAGSPGVIVEDDDHRSPSTSHLVAPSSINRRRAVSNEHDRPGDHDNETTNEADGDEEDDDEVGFWGASISPSSWSLPLSISPMSGWTSPGFFATRTGSAQGQRSQEPETQAIEDSDDGDWSTDESDEGETVDLDEDNDIDDIQLLGHR